MDSAFKNTEIFLVNIILNSLLYAVLLRFFLQWVKVDFYNPLCQLVIPITNPLLKPLRKLVKGCWGLDLAALILAYTISIVILIVINAILGTNTITWYIIWFLAITKLIMTTLNLYIWLIILRSLSTWFTQNTSNPVYIALYQLTNPLLSKVQKVFPPTRNGLDFSSTILIILMICLQIFIGSLVNF